MPVVCYMELYGTRFLIYVFRKEIRCLKNFTVLNTNTNQAITESWFKLF